ncbi:core-2/I-Branching enzyme family protein [Aphelenchoides avenae]|nr:core-2/I-Branching enzyme family protein [Aphelenchus avenae]
MGYAHYECMKALLKKSPEWKYLILLQNHDVALKTNQEMMQILQWFNGANDVQTVSVPRERVDFSKNWTFEALRLFKNETRNRIAHNGLPPKMDFAKSLVESCVSRAMIEFMVNDLDLTGILKQIETSRYGIDEIVLPTLNSNDAVSAPGGFTQECLRRRKDVPYVSRYATTRANSVSITLRYTIWSWTGKDCRSKRWRHSICIFGVEDLASNLAHNSRLFANKMMPEFDFGATSCWHELMFNRSHFNRGIHRLSKSAYTELPHVRYQTEKQRNRTMDLKSFDCDYHYRGELPKGISVIGGHR